MTNEELVEKIQQGERDLLPQLWEQVERLITKIAVRWARATERSSNTQAMEFAEELVHTGYIAVVEAVDTFDAEQKCSFTTHLGFYLKKHFSKECAAKLGATRGIYSRAQAAMQKKKQGQELDGQEQKMVDFCFPTSLNVPVGDSYSDAGRNELGNFIPDSRDDFTDTENRIFQQQLHKTLEEILSTLEPDENSAIKLQYYQTLDRQAVANALGISCEQVRSLETSAMRKLRNPSITAKLENYVEQRTPYFLHVGVEAFHSSGTSAVERIVMLREQLRERKGG